MAVNVNWLQEKANVLHCHLQGTWMIEDLCVLVEMYQRKTAGRKHPFDVILTADRPDALPTSRVVLPVHPAQRNLLVVNAYTFYQQLTDVLVMTPSASTTVFVGSWNEACHFADGAA